jgi:hypothetical protein
MAEFNFFGLTVGTRSTGSAYLPDTFPMPIASNVFVENDVQAVYAKILTDVIERCDGIPEEAQPSLWDSCLQSEAPEGLVTILSKSMEKMTELFLVYKDTVLRHATSEETAQIRADYKKSGKSNVGVYVSFKNYKKTEMVQLYSTLEYCVISALYKGSNLSKAIQYKISDLRSSVGLTDSALAKAQAKEVADALALGRDVMLDAKDEIASHKPDLEATKQSIEFLDSKRCFYLGLPRSYINGEQSGGLSDTGSGDSKAIERGLKNYFVSIVKPVLEAVFGIKVTYKGTDMVQIDTALEAMKTFELVGENLLSLETKRSVIAKLLGVDPELEEYEEDTDAANTSGENQSPRVGNANPVESNNSNAR